MLQVPGGRPWIVDRQKYFRVHMAEYGYDIPAMEGKTIIVDGERFLIKDGLPVALDGPAGML
jgi:hypothetical protein